MLISSNYDVPSPLVTFPLFYFHMIIISILRYLILLFRVEKIACTQKKVYADFISKYDNYPVPQISSDQRTLTVLMLACYYEFPAKTMF